MTIAVLDGTFKLIEKTTHLKCDLRDTQYWHMGVDTAAHDDQIDTIGYPTAALAESYFTNFRPLPRQFISTGWMSGTV